MSDERYAIAIEPDDMDKGMTLVSFKRSGEMTHLRSLPTTLAEQLAADHAKAALLDEAAKALEDVLDGVGALGGSWWELCGHGITDERAQEICAILTRLRDVPVHDSKGG